MLDVRVYDQCQLLTLSGVGSLNLGLQRRLLLPFDALEPVGRTRRLRIVKPRLWRRAFRALLSSQAPPGTLRATRQARIDLLPHQLEPALAIIRGRGSRLLIADDVGLGKTIQAGLIVAELLARGTAERALILTPAGLRDQWASELSQRFDIIATRVDFRAVRRRVSSLPVGVNPWSTVPLAIASVDYVKRPEVLPSVLSCRWDVVIVDETHGIATESDRHDAVSAIAARAGYVVLLTATPHNGDSRAFDSLCNIGTHGDRLLVFRRTRQAVRLAVGRHVHRLYVRPSGAELRMHDMLPKFTRVVRDEHESDGAWLALSVLHKRALSSARALERSIERRLAALGPVEDSCGRQLALPIDDPRGELDRADDPPDGFDALALDDPGRERRLLRALAASAHSAATRETKIAALRRLLNRIAEPAVVFTEYRDTLLHLRDSLRASVAILHGGLACEERAAALDDFASGRRPILIATDAAGEGLNLHHTCRLVVNLELPWNPMRLEQRIGRVDSHRARPNGPRVSPDRRRDWRVAHPGATQGARRASSGGHRRRQSNRRRREGDGATRDCWRNRARDAASDRLAAPRSDDPNHARCRATRTGSFGGNNAIGDCAQDRSRGR